MTVKVFADGSLAIGTTFLKARIVGTSPRELVAAGDDLRVDVTEAWGTPGLGRVVEALLDRSPLPDGFNHYTRRDGIPMVCRNRA